VPKVIWKKRIDQCRIDRMAMTYRVKATLDSEAEAALDAIMKRTGWTKSRAVREAIWVTASSQGMVRGPSPDQLAAKKSKVKS